MNFDSSKAKKVNRNRYSIWQYLVIVITLIIMGLSALPNFYPSLTSVQMSPLSEQSPILSTLDLQQLLQQQGFEVRSISSDGQRSLISLYSAGQNSDLLKFLSSEFKDSYNVKLVQQDSTPQWLKSLGGAPIKLGLDLSGGVLFVLDVDIEHALSEKTQNLFQSIKTHLREQRIRDIQVTFDNQHTVILSYQNSSNVSALIKAVQQHYPNLTAQKAGDDQMALLFDEADKMQFKQEVMQQTLTTMRARIEELGITEAVIQRQGVNKIRIELPGANNPQEARPIIGATASLDFYELQMQGGRLFNTEDGSQVRVNPKPIFTGDHIRHAQAGHDEMGIPMVALSLDSEGGNKMQRFSSQNIGRPIVTVYSEFFRNSQGETVKESKVINIATIQTALGSQFSITNLSSSQTASDLVMLLRAGSLVAPVTVSKERTISATLGETNISNGFFALAMGIGLTLLFMALWYRRLGLISNCALFLNLICLLGLMSLLPGVVLTLPGIAGLVLTVGMAVDTNVLIFERIKQERKRGRSIAAAVDVGYRNAMSTIMDANITTLLTAVVLYSIGYGPVKGFAVTLALGSSPACSPVYLSRGH